MGWLDRQQDLGLLFFSGMLLVIFGVISSSSGAPEAAMSKNAQYLRCAAIFVLRHTVCTPHCSELARLDLERF
jgi:hypothetical protein